MDTTKIGVIAQKAMAKVERDFPDKEWTMGEVVILVEMNRPYVEENVDEDTTTDFPQVETRLLKLCTSGRWADEYGLLAMASNSLAFGGNDGDDE